MKKFIPEFREGQVLRPKRLNLIRSALRKSGVQVEAPLTSVPVADGVVLGFEVPAVIWAKVTGGGPGGQYSWTQQLYAPAGGWTDGALGGTTTVDSALEANSYSTVGVGQIIHLRRESNRWLFFASTCP